MGLRNFLFGKTETVVASVQLDTSQLERMRRQRQDQLDNIVYNLRHFSGDERISMMQEQRLLEGEILRLDREIGW